ncbi:MAG: hypothetical protein L0H94_00360 [Nitrospira sp.]|nr:hypothetical protein [Nitrospira sp.]
MLLPATETSPLVVSKSSHRLARPLLVCIFAFSGFSGLIYEHIWTHYLKLFLGHAAYAQTLVLGIFMGGMAIGAWLSARYSSRWSNALQLYAITEGVIGVFGLVFHPTFEWVMDVAYSSVFAWLGTSMAIMFFKWGLSACLILPQSILLGMTFPLMSASLIRERPGDSGAAVAILYFTNSLGAAVGVLVSGYWLVGEVGLPGTILAAAILNILVALLSWLISKSGESKSLQPAVVNVQSTRVSDPLLWLLLGVACFTGVASFIYEISWIRMLSLILGSSTHSFELMLSAFVLGLAFGGLWIKRRIGEIRDAVRYLGAIQLVMGLFAFASIVVYPQLFHVMQAVMDSLSKTNGGYVLFNVISYLLSLGLMFPATFCAGMTLPLLTNALIQRQYGERSVGHVYASNTVGAILGVFAATHLGMPLLGLKGLVTAGAAIDMVLGVLLIWYVRQSSVRELTAGIAATVVLVIGSGFFVIEWNPLAMASGVYRTGKLLAPIDGSVLFHKDGKTATVDVVKVATGNVSIRTNGKPDASIQMDQRGRAPSDEDTMVMAAALPLALNPAAKTAANIGFGSGLTSHVLLGSHAIERVDTIEIEPAMVEGAEVFRPRVEAVFADPRSHVYIEDARTFFSTYNTRYDIIISEPSNPWVSGVASLFTDEFYRAIRSHLNQDGVLVQWFYLYEMEPSLVFSVLQAVNKNFSRVVLYGGPNGVDIFIVASNGDNVSVPSEDVFKNPVIRAELEPFAIKKAEDFTLLRIADLATLEPLLKVGNVPINSEYFPFLDLHAAQTRFLQHSAEEILNLAKAPIPLLEMIEGASLPFDVVQAGRKSKHFRRFEALQAWHAHQYLWGSINGNEPGPALLQDLALVKLRLFTCDGVSRTDGWLDALVSVSGKVNVFQTAVDASRFWDGVERAPCFSSLDETQKTWVALLRAVGSRQPEAMSELAERLLALKVNQTEYRRSYLLTAAMTGTLVQHDYAKTLALWDQYKASVGQGRQPALAFQLLVAHAVLRPNAIGSLGRH